MRRASPPPGRLRRLLDRWLFRIGAPEPAPIILGQRRIYVLPTGAGIAFAAALLVMLVASINYSVSLGFAFVFLLGGVGIASIVHAFRNLHGLSLAPGRAEPAFAGDTARFRLLVTNGRRSRRPALRLRTADGHAEFELAPGEVAEVELTRPTHRRGWLPLGRVVLETKYPLGLIRAWSVLVPDLGCFVYPAPERNPPPPPSGSADDAGRLADRLGDDDFAGLRAHRAEDSPRHIAWKALARGGPMLTKQFSGREGGAVTLDWAALPEDLDDERRLSRLAAWVLAADAAGLAYSLRLPDRHLARDADPTHARACLEALARFRTRETVEDSR